jgi:hypothetical protein
MGQALDLREIHITDSTITWNRSLWDGALGEREHVPKITDARPEIMKHLCALCLRGLCAPASPLTG